MADLRAVTDAVHAAGGKIAAQITHGGSFVTGVFIPKRLQALSQVSTLLVYYGNMFRRAMNEKDMARMVDCL